MGAQVQDQSEEPALGGSAVPRLSSIFRRPLCAGTAWLHRHCWLILLIALAILHGVLYALVIPPWQSPDETGHFEYVWLLAHLRRLPGRDDVSPGLEGQLIDSLYRWRFGVYLGQPLPEERPERLDELPSTNYAQRARTVRAERFSLGYAVQALATLPLVEKGLEVQLYASRLSSVLLNASIVALAYLTARELVPQQPGAAVLAAGIVLLIPQHTFINATVSDGTLAEVGTALAIYGWVRAFRYRLGPLEVVAIAVGTLVANLSKRTAVFMIGADALLAVWWAVRRARHGWSWQQAAWLAAALLSLAGGGWLWLQTRLGVTAVDRLWPLPAPAEWTWVDQRGMTLGAGLLTTHDSLWANFGWMNLPLSKRWYGAILGASGLALAGWTVGSGRGYVRFAQCVLHPAPMACARAARVDHASPVTSSARPKRPLALPWEPLMMLLLLAAGAGVYAWVALLGRPDGYYQFQGRYLFPVLLPWAYLLAAGWTRLTGGRRGTTALFLAALALLDAWAMAMYAVPYYYGG